ncbi:MAG TPA: CAAX prenyl protease-related protein [Verrucomicrobiae bacterium]|nr:CAAX prenyl protease-related protein [Verrucomicrobiae bacterium]
MSQSPVTHSSATFAYVAPFVAFVAVMALERVLALPLQWLYPARFAIVLAIVLVFSRPYLTSRPGSPVASIVIGLVVFGIWIAPDLLFGYRNTFLFNNGLTGAAKSSLPPGLRQNAAFLVLRCVSAFALVPVVEELFWRGFLMRWLIRTDFLKVPLGTWSAYSFWIVAILFASEHGPYWEVGLLAGIVYNWWIVRTRNLADCILAHAVTNAALCAWVLYTGQWQYWM